MAQVLSAYQSQLQSLLHDTTGAFYPTASITTWVNEARQRVAYDSQCIRILPPSGALQNQTVAAQEVYPFSAVNAFVQLTAGVSSVAWVRQVAVSWGSMKPALRYYPWTDFNAYFRSYSIVQGYPSCWSQFGQGASGTLYLWPIPSSAQPMDWDCVCTPVDLVSDATVDALPSPFDGAVQYYAAYLAFMFAQRDQDAELMMQRYKRRVLNARATSAPGLTVDPYGG